MAETNRDRIGRMLELLSAGLEPFVTRECEATLGQGWADSISPDRAPKPNDIQFLLKAMRDSWDEVFRRTLSASDRNLVHELTRTRNEWAHQEQFSSDDTYRALDNAERLLKAVSAPEEAREVEAIRRDLQQVQVKDAARQQKRKKAAEPLEGLPSAELRPWRDLVSPHADVAKGTYQQAEFAADLHQVWRGEAEAEYGQPEEFFRRTFLTEGLRALLLDAAKRLSGVGGNPIIQLQTNFGGGKTHSLIALYHLAAGADPARLVGVVQMLADAGVPAPPAAHRAVLVGQMLDPGAPRTKDDGTEVNTIWGELAWQLGGAEAFALVAQADAARTSPGDALIELLRAYSPCLILIDEWVAYARQLYDREGLAGGSFDAQMTFAQALSDATKSVPNAMLVVSIPASDIEVGGEAGKAALDRLTNVFMRQETSWKPASPEEGFEIVRRRLFDEIPDEARSDRDAVVDAFAHLYATNSAEFPSDAKEGLYRDRLRSAYPIHPALFDQLFETWSTLEKFQRTRGVLRLMAAVIHELWDRDDSGLMIMPGSVPIDASAVQAELTRYLEDGWTAVIESDVDGPNALSRRLDKENPNFKRVSAARRVARTVYIGSAPTLRQTNQGIDDRAIRLGCVQPGEPVAVFGDALRRLATNAMYLTEDRGQYWYALGQTISRTARDRKESRFSEADADDEIIARLNRVRDRGDFTAVHWAPQSPSDVPDDDSVRLVVLGPDHTHASGTAETAAKAFASRVMTERSGGARVNRNMLAFVAPDAGRLEELRDAARSYLAWKSIVDEHEELNLDAQQRRSAESQAQQFDQDTNARTGETFSWLLTPLQQQGAQEVTWEQHRLQGQDGIPVKASKRLRTDELLVIDYSGARVRMDLDRVPLWDGDDISTATLWSYYAKYLYLPRLRDSDVLARALENGVASLAWQQDTFAYADARNENGDRYVGLTAGSGAICRVDGSSLVVKADVAQRQFETDASAGGGSSADPSLPTPPGDTDVGGGSDPEPAVDLNQRFYGSASVTPERMSRDCDAIANEVVKHLVGIPGATVTVRIDIEAHIEDGAGDDVVRTVTENARTLKFDQFGFEGSA